MWKIKVYQKHIIFKNMKTTCSLHGFWLLLWNTIQIYECIQNMSVPLVKVCLRRVPFGFYDPQHAAKHQSLQKCRYKYQIRHKINLKGMKSTGWITITGVHTHVHVLWLKNRNDIRLMNRTWQTSHVNM